MTTAKEKPKERIPEKQPANAYSFKTRIDMMVKTANMNGPTLNKLHHEINATMEDVDM